MIKEILLLGNPALYEISEVVREEELPEMEALERDLHDTMMEFRLDLSGGPGHRGAADRSEKRVLYMNVGEPVLLINPVLEFPGRGDDGGDGRLHVISGSVGEGGPLPPLPDSYKDRSWQDKEMELEGDLFGAASARV